MSFFKNKGFSLIELVIVISIIGILSGIIAPTFLGQQRNSRLDLSRELIMTALSKSFSSARSQNRIFGVRTVSDGYEFFECDFIEEGCIADDKVEKFPFEGGVIIKTDFEIQFIPPFGDILEKSFTEEELEIILENEGHENEQKSFKIYKKSGLIEKI